MHRYQIKTCKQTDPRDTYLLERAFARVSVAWAHMVNGVEVSGAGGGSGGGFVIVIDVVGSPARARIECERLFAAAWYDAFGSRGSTHIGLFIEQPSPSSREALAA